MNLDLNLSGEIKKEIDNEVRKLLKEKDITALDIAIRFSATLTLLLSFFTQVDEEGQKFKDFLLSSGQPFERIIQGLQKLKMDSDLVVELTSAMHRIFLKYNKLGENHE